MHAITGSSSSCTAPSAQSQQEMGAEWLGWIERFCGQSLHWREEENTSCLVADGMRTCWAERGQANVISTQHLRSSVFAEWSSVRRGGGHKATVCPELCFRCTASRQQDPHSRPLLEEHLSKSRCPGRRSWTVCPDPLSTDPDKTGLHQNHQEWCYGNIKQDTDTMKSSYLGSNGFNFSIQNRLNR